MKHRWRMDLNWLCGATASTWHRLRREHGVDAAYAHRAAQITVLSAYNSAVRRFDRHPPRPLKRDPVFVLGHWRSGTTWLYHRMAEAPGLTAPNAFQVVNPLTFRASEPVASRVFAGLVPEKRVQDDVPLGFALPEEDEYAIALLAGTSPYLGRSFPRALPFYERFLTLDACTDAERTAFHRAMRVFLGRLMDGADARPLLKSPAHTARVKHLLRWFPDARFVHIHRDPFAVFASTRHLYDTVDWFWTLQRRDGSPDATILRQYRAVHDAWFASRDLIAPGHLVELAYEDLVADPQGQLDRVFAGLGLGAAPTVPARPHRANRFPDLSEADQDAVRDVAAACFDAWGYPSRARTATGQR
ncbi:MAG: sulfotransferase [Myxococcota bacterium]